ncbi:hypothetical protein CDD81_471 [Ophiocordyceps australis]|uniref:DUF895 domain membrane protein n=1 Tax=Ophiocordyceps australis TaxID=1399860 RepID=A0A2C5XXZ8_9HYPO|nr:hypothetical protein CDD81_471 [Ophiocordyceps australis]
MATTSSNIHNGSPPALSSTQTKRQWYHTTLFNAIVIGAVGFLAPGLWNATNALGAGGAQEPYLINAANALVYTLMGLLCILGGPIANRIGLARTLFFGAVGYPVYSAGLYANNRSGNVWLVLVGAAACGVSAGLFWASEGAVALGYPEPAKRGRYMNIWLWFRTGGPLLGGAIVLALNNSAEAKSKGKVASQTYIIFIALQCLGPLAALLLSPPYKLQREDGTKIIMRVEATLCAEIKALWRACVRRDILVLLPMFWAADFNQYNGNFLTYYFGIRARALVGFIINFGTLASSQIMSSLLDYGRFPVSRRIQIGFYYAIAVNAVAWIYAWIIQAKYTAHAPSLDWQDRAFIEGFLVLLLWDFARQALQNWLYYYLATKTDNLADLTRFCGILRGQESFAQAVSFGLNTKKWHGGRVPMAVNSILLGAAAVSTAVAITSPNPPPECHEHGMTAENQDSSQLGPWDALGKDGTLCLTCETNNKQGNFS